MVKATLYGDRRAVESKSQSDLIILGIRIMIGIWLIPQAIIV